ncbi:hypothetical protein AVDCRST_MAG94-115 [uncultured Leptolyngbya sp.]|uniref:Uncharacterized protein n=1 Tax=uncultured Leptolyngbya sp. TaxID=332963 RepID=A0A6J4K6L7_9CYAN|nr:hypothetical protein AVDCRST_MAG94-115 [uncultured Leptolyngbya sp.]
MGFAQDDWLTFPEPGNRPQKNRALTFSKLPGSVPLSF